MREFALGVAVGVGLWETGRCIITIVKRVRRKNVHVLRSLTASEDTTSREYDHRGAHE